LSLPPNDTATVHALGDSPFHLTIVHLEWMIDNESRPNRTLPTSRSGIFSWIARRDR